MKRCLVVDDSSVIRKVAGKILRDSGFEVTEAENGCQAIELCHHNLPDAILLDWHMPEMGAYEFLEALAPLRKGAKPFVVYCTTENDRADLARAYAAGADDYLLKPFDRRDLVAKFKPTVTLAGSSLETRVRADRGATVRRA